MIVAKAIAAIFLMPVDIALVLMIVGIVRKQRVLCWLGVVVLWLASTPVPADALMRATEQWSERLDPTTMPECDAIVVLSEGRLQPPGYSHASEWTDADRFFGGVSLYKAHKAPLLIFTGGWSPNHPLAKTEGEVLTSYATEIGIPRENILTTSRVENTEAEARAVAALLTLKKSSNRTGRILLVTSAFHMRRAKMLFEHAGTVPTPFPVDFKVSANIPFSFRRLLPNAASMLQSETAFREFYAYLFYLAYYQLTSSKN